MARCCRCCPSLRRAAALLLLASGGGDQQQQAAALYTSGMRNGSFSLGPAGSLEGGGNHTLVGSLVGTTLRVAFIRYSNELQPTDPACCPADGYSCVGCQWSGNTPSRSRAEPSGLSRLSVPDSVCAGSWGRRSP